MRLQFELPGTTVPFGFSVTITARDLHLSFYSRSQFTSLCYLLSDWQWSCCVLTSAASKPTLPLSPSTWRYPTWWGDVENLQYNGAGEGKAEKGLLQGRECSSETDIVILILKKKNSILIFETEKFSPLKQNWSFQTVDWSAFISSRNHNLVP